MKNMTREECRDYLIRRAAITEDLIRLQENAGRMFIEVPAREIHISSCAWAKVIDAMQPVVTYNPNWQCPTSRRTEAYFTTELFGKIYKVFTLLERKEE